jgi:light-regulated signal transduction histidine kinase (bacteriophytochrome)
MNAKEEKVPVDCGAVVAEVLESFEEPVKESGAKIVATNLPVVTAGPLRMKQMFQNLISNALKYRSPDRDLVVTVSAEDKGSEYLFSVADNGLGIDPAHRTTIFQPFKRLHSRDEIEGTGLGLSICRKIAEIHQGRIWVDSEPGKGSVFYFTIPKPEARRFPLYRTA